MIELDIQKFFDTVRWDLVVRAVEAHTDAAWVVSLCQAVAWRLLSMLDGTLVERDQGTPRGSSVSPVLASLFMHYAFDLWLEREFPTVQFERYADDAVIHCVTERRARQVLSSLGDRMAEVGLRLHPDKTRIVYCRDDKRRGSCEHTSFTFLGFTFCQRPARDRRGRPFWPFLPAISKDAQKKIGKEIRSWRLHRWTNLTFAELARRINPIVAGWMQYYGRYYRSAMRPLLTRINAYLARWLRAKYERLSARMKAVKALQGAAERNLRLFAHWRWTPSSARGPG